MNNYKLVAPDIDSLLNCFERGFLNPSAPSEALCKAMDPLFEMLREMAPLRKNDEAKAIWVTIPRGSIGTGWRNTRILSAGMNWSSRKPFIKTVPDGSGQFILATNRSSMRILIITMMRKPDSLTGRKPSLLSALFLRNRSWNPCGG